jgi:sugar phosphate isomerase/epimerase
MSKRLADVVSLCAFADEADPNLAGQIRALQENGIGLIELRGVNGTNVAALTAEQAKEIRRELDAGGVKVWALGSPAGKSKITQDFAVEEEQFKRLLETADLTGAACIRLFSFYGTDGKAEWKDEVLRRLSRFVELAKGSGVRLCHENEKGIYGDLAIRCAEIHQAIPELDAVFDPANFVQCGQDITEAWSLLAPYTYYGHIKDARADGHVVPPGEGIVPFAHYLRDFAARGGRVLTLEPHLTEFTGLKALEVDDPSHVVGGWSFASHREAFDFAVKTFNKILEETNV